MSKVKLLDTVTINKIAAGEVVERPASCVKELVENAIDADATRIEVEIIEGGKTLIRVTDNGIGMVIEDAALALRRHATSKLSSVEDLQSISTLGFRGEALPTIAAVSNFTLQTRTANSELGTKITVSGGKILDTNDIGCKIGTTVLVENLFFNVPARLKFLKSTPTEAGKIHDFIVKLALSRPDISFKFINGNRAVLMTPGNGKLIDTLTAIYGVEISKSLLDVKFSASDFEISGYVGKPNFLTSYRSRQTFIVNGRVVANKTIYKAIDEGYKSLVSKTGYPLVVLKIEVPQNSIDVNVHPQKIEIKFQDEGELFSHIQRAIREAVSEKRVTSDLKKVAATPDKPRYTQLDLDEYFGDAPKSDFIIDPKDDKPQLTIEELRSKVDKQEENLLDDENILEEEVPVQTQPKDLPAPKISEKPLEKLYPIGQVALCYIVAQSDSDLYLIDQHAAHERILFDKFNSYVDNVPAQILLIHENLKFDSRETSAIENNLELFDKLGFSMELSGENEFRLKSVPADAANANASEMLREIISSLPESDFPAQVDESRRTEIAANIRRTVIAIASCRGAIKAGQKLSHREMELLLNDLSNTPHPHTCPHGRPTIIKFTRADLAKMFKRT
ncbi:MAG: DNA mismatch repair endonuclease MutL [Selenomonadaceae bacterium]|nr:DNA mismatch repair endonuclease MutL [Selenomonadaceae bacterium]